MNCKPGDLAFVTCGRNRDRVVTVSRWMLRGEAYGGWEAVVDGWLVFGRLTGTYAGRIYESSSGCIPDAYLRPIRPNEGEDETLQWAPVPGQKVEVLA